MPSKLKFSFASAWSLAIAYWLLLLFTTLALVRGIGFLPLSAVLTVETLSLPVFAWMARATWSRIMSEAAAVAFKDPLTGLANRGFFMDRLREALARSQRGGAMVSVLFLDFDKFKNLNDTLGHAAGDALLREAGVRFQKNTRAGEMAARLGGDEFTFLLEGIKSVAAAEAAAARIQRVLTAPFMVEGHEVVMTASIGLALNDSPFCPADEMVRRADVALYQAKAAGRNCYRVFTAREESQGFDSLDLGSGLRKAIERNELVLYFQPEIDLHTGGVSGFEALVRWNHPRRGLLTPVAFVPIAEDSGLMRPLGKWVLLEACRVALEVGETFPELADCTVSVNVSPVEFSDSGFHQDIASALKSTGLPPQRLKLEIVESTLMKDPDATAAILKGLQDLGVKLAIDDFGTGYSSLSYLRRFPVDTLKIDRSFVMEAPHDKRVLAIMRAIVALAAGLGVDVTAEGIETREELGLVMDCGCSRGQGYLFARPLPRAALRDYLASQYADPRPRVPVAS